MFERWCWYSKPLSCLSNPTTNSKTKNLTFHDFSEKWKKKHFKTLVCLGIWYYFLRQKQSDQWEISGFVVSELVVGFGEQDISMVYLYQSVQADL